MPLSFWNGQAQRQPVTVVTGRGYALRQYYVPYRRWGKDARVDLRYDVGLVRLLEPPGDLVGLPPDAPAVRRFVVETLRGGNAADPVAAPRRVLLSWLARHGYGPLVHA